MSGIFYQDFPCAERDKAAPTVVLLHGWGMHADVWASFIPLLTPHVHVRCIDLPGCGRSAGLSLPSTLGALAELMIEVMPAQAILVGWSLGGLLALAVAANHPQRVSYLVLMAATPCFVQRDDWLCAMPLEVFEQFTQDVAQNAEQGLKRFMALQCHGSASHKQDLRFLQACAAQQPMSSDEVLMQSLDFLKENDGRSWLEKLAMPVHVVLGEHDALVPVSAAPALNVLRPSATVSVVSGAAHVPFLSHPQACHDALLHFIGEAP